MGECVFLRRKDLMGALSSNISLRTSDPRCGSTSWTRTSSEIGETKLEGVSGGGDCIGEGGFALPSSGMEG